MSYAKQYKKKWAQNNPEKVKIRNKKWQKENPEKYAIICKKHARKSSARRRRDLGYTPVNKMEAGEVGHHVDKNLVVYIPENLHKSIVHSQKNLRSMKEINILAIQTCYV